MTLRIVHSQTMSRAEIAQRAEKAVRDLCDARAAELSLYRRFECAYEAAYECALAFAGIMNLPIQYGERRHREAFHMLLRALVLPPGVSLKTERIVDHHYLEHRLFYRGATSTDEAIVLETIEWAQQLQAAVLESLTCTPADPAESRTPPDTD